MMSLKSADRASRNMHTGCPIRLCLSRRWLLPGQVPPAAEAGRSGRDAVVDVDDTIAEPALVEELEVSARVARKRRLARTDEYWTDEQLTLIDEPRPESVRGEVRASHGEIFDRGSLQVTDAVGVEVALELRLGGR